MQNKYEINKKQVQIIMASIRKLQEKEKMEYPNIHLLQGKFF